MLNCQVLSINENLSFSQLYSLVENKFMVFFFCWLLKYVWSIFMIQSKGAVAMLHLLYFLCYIFINFLLNTTYSRFIQITNEYCIILMLNWQQPCVAFDIFIYLFVFLAGKENARLKAILVQIYSSSSSSSSNYSQLLS